MIISREWELTALASNEQQRICTLGANAASSHARL